MQGDVYNNTCNVVDGLTTNINPCTQGIFACSPPPIIFHGYTNTLTGLRLVSMLRRHLIVILALAYRYVCRTDANSGTCDGTIVSVCVSTNFEYLTTESRFNEVS